MNIKIISSKEEYENALRRLEEIFDSVPGTNDSDEADLLALIIEDYENKCYPIMPPDPIEAIKIRMEEMQLKQKDLVGIIGNKSKVSEVLNRKRKLTLDMIRNLKDKLNLPLAVLLNDYYLAE
jgi:HTH-type transcriptional regulator/antitoxin HigA